MSERSATGIASPRCATSPDTPSLRFEAGHVSGPAVSPAAGPENDGIRALIYISMVAGGCDASARALAASVQAANRQHGLTGMLLGNGSTFMQLLEGHPTSVSEVFELIRNDPRHHSVEILSDSEVTTRTFAGCAMLGLDLDTSPYERRVLIEAAVPETADARVRQTLVAFSVFD